MPLVKDFVSHILFHVNGEAAENDPSQTAAVAVRALLVRNAVGGFRADSRDLTPRVILQEIHDAIPNQTGRASFRRAIVNMQDDHRPQLAIQTWVGKARERR